MELITGNCRVGKQQFRVELVTIQREVLSQRICCQDLTIRLFRNQLHHLRRHDYQVEAEFSYCTRFPVQFGESILNGCNFAGYYRLVKFTVEVRRFIVSFFVFTVTDLFDPAVQALVNTLFGGEDRRSYHIIDAVIL